MSKGKQRGSGWSVGLALFLYNLFGYKFLYYLLYPITFFYFLVAKNVRRSLDVYYTHLNRPLTTWGYFSHLRIFAVCLVDRFVSKMSPQSYTFEYGDKEIPVDILENGAILLYSHVGGWAASQNSAHVNNKINIVMQESMLDGIREIERKFEIKSQLNIIDLNQGSISVSIQVANAIMNNEIVAIMGDRAANEKSELEVSFLGESARFNKNPFQIAYKVKKPIVVYFIVFSAMQTYKVEYLVIELDQTLQAEDAVKKAMMQYVEKYEEIVKKYPEQWFNFYDFWEKK